MYRCVSLCEFTDLESRTERELSGWTLLRLPVAEAEALIELS